MKTSALRPLMALIATGLSAVPAFGADDPAPAAVLAKHGLTRVAQFYELDVDAHLGQRLAAVHKLETDFQNFVRKRQGIEGEINHAETVLNNLGQRLAAVDAQLNAPNAKEAVGTYNDLVGQHNTLVHQIEQGRTFIKQRSDDLNKLTSPTPPIATRVALENDVEAAQAQYTALAADPEVTAALAALNPSGPRLRLGPSPLFTSQLPLLRRQHEIDSKAAVEGKVEHNLLTVSVQLNGNSSTPMIVDSGASVVCISAKVAKDAGIEIVPGSDPIEMTTASGEKVQAHQGIIKTLSVGQFTATDVACAIMPAPLGDVDCLLGETFLSKFLYQIDLGGGELRLTPISSNASIAADAAPGAGAAPTSQPAATQPAARRPARRN